MTITLNNIKIDLQPNCNLSEYLNLHPNAAWWKDIITFLEQWSNDTENITIRTSGSTGDPKEMEVRKPFLWVSASKTCDFFNLTNETVGLLCLSANYIAGKMMLVRAMVSGMNLICIEPTNNPVKHIENTIDFAAMVPMQVTKAMQTPDKLNRIQHLIIGGGQVSSQLVEDLKYFKGYSFETYGMTETLSHIALKELTPNKQESFKVFQGININKGYKNELIIDYPELGIYRLKTNDIVELTSNGGFTWIGRSDFVINSGGVKISPEQIEKQINHLLEQPYCFIGLPDETLGEKLVLIIEGEEFNTKELQLELKGILPPYSIPKEIQFIKELPVTENGKIKRKEIRLAKS